jgi:hypothetical protein
MADWFRLVRDQQAEHFVDPQIAAIHVDVEGDEYGNGDGKTRRQKAEAHCICFAS